MPTRPPAQITLSYSRTAGLIAIAHGEQYQWAHTALEQAGFTKRDDGSYCAPGRDMRVTAAKLLPIAHRHRATVDVNRRPYLGDVADQIATRLPGTWTAQMEIYSHPLWQEDLLPWLWDRGEFLQAVEHERLPYAAKLTSNTGIELLLGEHGQEPELGYLVAALASYKEFEDSYDDPYAPASIPLPSTPDSAARAITDTFLPAYHHALFTRRLAAVVAALDAIRPEYDTLKAMQASGRSSDGIPLTSSQTLQAATRAFADQAWLQFQPVLTHAPGVLEECNRTVADSPGDARIVSRLRDALASTQAAVDEWENRKVDLILLPHAALEPPAEARTRLGLQVMPAIETWLAESEAFLRIAKAATPKGPVPPPAGGALPTASPALPPRQPSARR